VKYQHQAKKQKRGMYGACMAAASTKYLAYSAVLIYQSMVAYHQ